MVGIFYFKENLNDSLVVNFSDEKIVKTSMTKEFCIGYSEGEKIAFINIFSFSEYCELGDGFLPITNKLIKIIHKITGVNLKDFDIENKFVHGKIIDTVEIDGTHLHKCTVEIANDRRIDIICGAKNVKKDLVTVVALSGAILPSGKRIKSGKVLGHLSDGMLCSAKELNIIENNEGIVEINGKVKIGSFFEEIYAEKENAIL